MIRAVAFCPMAPVLVPDVAQGAAGELDDLRAACREAVSRAHAPDRRWIVLGPAGTSRTFGAASRGTFAGYGVELEVGLTSSGRGPLELPPSLTVGAWLLHDALGTDALEAVAVGPEGGIGHLTAERDIALLVTGDGSARRGVKAPGYLDERAAAYDAGIERALGSGDPGALAALDTELGAQLLAAGVPAWHAVAPFLHGKRWVADVLYADDPYGVFYAVASWVTRA